MHFTLIVIGCVIALTHGLERSRRHGPLGIYVAVVGPSLYDGLHKGATGASDMTFFRPGKRHVNHVGIRNEYTLQKAGNEIAIAHPARTLELAFLKAGRSEPLAKRPRLLRGPIFSVLHIVICALTVFVAGAIDLRRRLSVVAFFAGDLSCSFCWFIWSLWGPFAIVCRLSFRCRFSRRMELRRFGSERMVTSGTNLMERDIVQSANMDVAIGEEI